MEKLKLLIVDDSTLVRERLRLMLNDVENINVVGNAENYNQAMDVISTTCPDIVILDLNMPGKNGLDLLVEIKLMINPSLVIIMSNEADSYYRNLCKKMGADYFFDKSTEFHKIPDVLNGFVRL